MKKSLLFILACVFTLNGAFAQNRAGVVAAADAAGALGGAGSVASIASWFSWTPAAPVAAIAVGVGAIIGGVGTSLAVSSSSTQAPRNPSTIGSDVRNTANYFDQVGVLHNQMLYDYRSQNTSYSPQAFYNFVSTNKATYGMTELYITPDYLAQQYSDTRTFKDIQSVNTYILNNLPSGVDRNAYSQFLNGLSNISDRAQAINYIKQFETSELNRSTYNDKTKGILGGFFATYRYSVALWY